MRDAVFVSDRFSQKRLLKDVLRHWCVLLKRYEPDDGDEMPDFEYWYGERPLTGLLGSAACMLHDGWSEDAPDDGSLGSFCFGQRKTRMIAVAKIYWVAEDMPEASANVLKKLDDAREQLQALPERKRRGDPVSVCYVVPEYDGREAQAKGLKALSDLERWAKSKSMATAKHLTSPGPNAASEGSEYPGVLLVARQE